MRWPPWRSTWRHRSLTASQASALPWPAGWSLSDAGRRVRAARPQVEAAQLRALLDRSRMTRQCQRPPRENADIAGEDQSPLDVPLDEHHRGAGRAQPRQALVDPLDHDRGQAEGDFIEENQAWIAHQRPADREHLLLASGKGCAWPPTKLRELGKQVVDPFQPFLDGPPADRSRDLEVLLDAQVAEDTPAFHTVRDAERADFVRRKAGHVDSVRNDAARIGADNARHHVREGRLPCAVGPEQ